MASTSMDTTLGHDADVAVAALAVARRFAAGATMWCLAPEWPEHAHHVAVEFVHPVIVGKRALPAVAVEADGATARLRSSARAGDILLAVSTAYDPTVIDVLRRAPAWGLTTLWLGAGERPVAPPVDHLVWLDGSGPLVRHDGTFVLTYHVLWELVHVCFEHPGLLTGAETACDDEVCVTCIDEGRIAEVTTRGTDGFTSVRSAHGIEVVDTTLVEPLAVGDLVLIHAGTVITRVQT